MATTMITVKRSDAVAIFEGHKFQTAPQWDDKKLHSKLLLLADVAEDNPLEDARLQWIVEEIMTAIADGGTIELEDDGTAPAPKQKKNGKKKDKPAAADNGEQAASGTSGEGAAAPKPKKEKPAKADAGPKKPGRSESAGVVIKCVGTDRGVTDAMVAKVNELCQVPNDRESRSSLTRAWHAICGYEGVVKSAPGVRGNKENRAYRTGELSKEKGFEARKDILEQIKVESQTAAVDTLLGQAMTSLETYLKSKGDEVTVTEPPAEVKAEEKTDEAKTEAPAEAAAS